MKKQTIAINNAEKGTKTKIQARNSKSKKFIGTVGPYSRQDFWCHSSAYFSVPEEIALSKTPSPLLKRAQKRETVTEQHK